MLPCVPSFFFFFVLFHQYFTRFSRSYLLSFHVYRLSHVHTSTFSCSGYHAFIHLLRFHVRFITFILSVHSCSCHGVVFLFMVTFVRLSCLRFYVRTFRVRTFIFTSSFNHVIMFMFILVLSCSCLWSGQKCFHVYAFAFIHSRTY